MVRIIFFSFLIGSFFALAKESPFENLLFEEANNYYKNKQYLEALSLYKKLLKVNNNNHSLLYNTANTYTKLFLSSRFLSVEGSLTNSYLAKSIYHYLLVQQISPGDLDTDYNLQYLKQFTLDNIGEKDPFSPDQLKSKLISKKHWFYLMSSLFFLLSVVLISIAIVINKKNKGIKTIAWIFIAMTIVSFILVFGINELKPTPTGIVLLEEVSIHSEPIQEENNVSFKLHEGTEIYLRSENGDWYEIFLPNGLSGWMLKKHCLAVGLP